MSASFHRPSAVRWTCLVLAGLGALGLASGAATTAAAVLVTLFDLSLAGDTSLAMLVGVLGLMGTMIGTALPLLGAQAVWEARPSARTLGGLVGVALLATPLFLVGGGLLMAVFGHGEVGRWLEDGRGLRLGRTGGSR